MLEFLLAPGFWYSLIKDGVSRALKRGRHLTKSEIVTIRKNRKDEIEEKLLERRRQKLGMDIIVRDVKRIDIYPDIEEKRGISAWFKCGLMGTYHRGALFGLSWQSLKKSEDGGWRYADYAKGERADLKVILIGYVRYENIESIDWDGDEYYVQPHFFCHFDARNGEPYERLAYCEKKELNGIPFYTEICEYEPVLKANQKIGLR